MTRWYLVHECNTTGSRYYGGARGNWSERRLHCDPFTDKRQAFRAKREHERETGDSVYVVRVGGGR